MIIFCTAYPFTIRSLIYPASCTQLCDDSDTSNDSDSNCSLSSDILLSDSDSEEDVDPMLDMRQVHAVPIQLAFCILLFIGKFSQPCILFKILIMWISQVGNAIVNSWAIQLVWIVWPCMVTPWPLPNKITQVSYEIILKGPGIKLS